MLLKALILAAHLTGTGPLIVGAFNGGTILSPIKAPDGAVGAPAYSFTSAPTTGLFLSGGNLHFSVSGTDRAMVSSVGVTTFNAFNLNNLGYLVATADGVHKLSNNADADFSRLQLGGTTASFPAIKKSGTTVAFRLADDSADAPITASNATLSGTMTSSLTTTLGWTPVSGANQLGTTTCTSACVFCFDTSAGSVLKSCSDATADICMCAGGS